MPHQVGCSKELVASQTLDRSRKLAIFLVMLTLFALPLAASANDWPQWRGPLLNGSTDETGLPATWDMTKDVKWAADLPGDAGSTPVIWGDRIFLTSSDKTSQNLYALCLNRADGKELWRKTIPGRGLHMHINRETGPSPVTDGQRIYFLFGHGVFLAFDLDGRPVWDRNLEQEFGALAIKFIYSASPLLHHGRLYLAMLREKDTTRDLQIYPASPAPLDSFLLCVDPATGKDIWKQPRPSDDVGLESRQSYSTPAVVNVGEGRTGIVTIGGNYLTAHDWETGKEIWRFKLNKSGVVMDRVVPTPVEVGGVVVAARPVGKSIFAVRPTGRGELTTATQSVAWSTRDNAPDVPSPLAYQGRLYYIQDTKKRISCVEPQTGRVLWMGDLGGTTQFFASPTGADGKIYCINLAGEVVVLAAGDQFKVLGRVATGGGNPSASTIVAAHGALFIRTATKLYCIECAKQ